MKNLKEIVVDKVPDIAVYPTTDMVNGLITTEDYIRKSASALYDDWVCDRRFSVGDICVMLLWEAERRAANE